MILLQKGYTALNRALKGEHTEVVKYLLSKGAKVSTLNIQPIM